MRKNAGVLDETMNSLMRAIRREAQDIIAASRLDPRMQAFLDHQGLTMRGGGIYFTELLARNGPRVPITHTDRP